MKNWFAGFTTVEAIKAEYRRLAMQYHPDRGGDTATMQEINAQYQVALKNCHGQKSTGTDGEEHTYWYREDLEQALVEKIDELLRSGIIRKGVECWLIGYWLWVEGDTKPIKETLKALGFQWHAKRVCWYWHDGQRRHTHSNASLEALAERYGARNIGKDRKADKDADKERPALM